LEHKLMKLTSMTVCQEVLAPAAPNQARGYRRYCGKRNLSSRAALTHH
jgi:hypothetical protein